MAAGRAPCIAARQTNLSCLLRPFSRHGWCPATGLLGRHGGVFVVLGCRGTGAVSLHQRISQLAQLLFWVHLEDALWKPSVAIRLGTGTTAPRQKHLIAAVKRYTVPVAIRAASTVHFWCLCAVQLHPSPDQADSTAPELVDGHRQKSVKAYVALLLPSTNFYADVTSHHRRTAKSKPWSTKLNCAGSPTCQWPHGGSHVSL